MERICFYAMLYFFVSGQVFAGPMFDPSKQQKNSELLPPPIEAPSDLKPEKPVPVSSQKDAREYLSGVLYYALKGKNNKPRQVVNNSQTEIQPDMTGAEMLAQTSTTWGPYNASNDTNQDVEPSVISIFKNQTLWTTTVYTKYVNVGEWQGGRNYFATTADFTNFNRGQLPLLTGYLFSGDPLLDENPYIIGISPGRIYATGTIFGSIVGPIFYPVTPSGIALWRSDDGGNTWTQPTVVANNPSDNNIFLDKPAIAVSNHLYSPDLGYVYVAWVKSVTNPPNSSSVYIARSTDGGTTFGSPVLIASGGNMQSPQVLVNPNYGTVYVLWVDFSMNAIRLSVSGDFGQSWSPPATGPTGSMLSGSLNGGIRAPSFLMARLNYPANKICFVWHELEEGSAQTDVYYAAVTPSGWQPKKRVNDDVINPYYRKDQFMPALDFEASGNLVVTFYDRRRDPNNLKYELYMARIDSNGNPLDVNRVVSPFQSDSQFYTNITGIANFIGDYQGVWIQPYSGTEYFLPAWIGIPPSSNIGDTYLSVIQP